MYEELFVTTKIWKMVLAGGLAPSNNSQTLLKERENQKVQLMPK